MAAAVARPVTVLAVLATVGLVLVTAVLAQVVGPATVVLALVATVAVARLATVGRTRMFARLHQTDARLNIDVTLADWMPKVIRNVLISDKYEQNERSMVEASVHPYDRVVELGAGLGVISAMCAKVVGDGNVVCYEANPKMIDPILDTYRLNGVAPVIRNAVLGETAGGTVPLYIHEEFWKSSLVPDPIWQPVTVEMVPVVNGSDALLNASFLICDIEGGEAELFKTLDLPASLKKILVEVHPHLIGAKGLDRMLADFYSHGFTLVATGGDVWFLARA